MASGFPLGYDFHYYWAAGRIAFQGGNPYDPQLLLPEMLLHGWPQNEGVYALFHPPWMIWLYVIFSFLPFEIAKIVWFACIAGTTLLCGLLLRPYLETLSDNQKQSKSALMLCTLTFPFLASNLYWGQTNFVFLLGLTLYMICTLRKQNLLAGIGLSLTLLKPHIFIPLYAYVAGRALIQKDIKVVLGGAIGLSLQALLSWIFCAGVYQYYLEGIRGVRQAAALSGAGLSQLLFSLAGIAIPIELLVTLGVLIGIWFAVKGVAEQEAWPRILPLSLLVISYAWSHYFLVLLYPWLRLMNKFVKETSRPVRVGLVVLFLLGFLQAAMFWGESFMAFIPLVILLIYCYNFRLVKV